MREFCQMAAFVRVKKSSPAVSCLQKAMEHIKSKEEETEQQRKIDMHSLKSEESNVLKRMKDQFQAVVVEAMGRGLASITIMNERVAGDMKSPQTWGEFKFKCNLDHYNPSPFSANSIPYCLWRFPSMYPEWSTMMISIWNWWLVSESGFTAVKEDRGYLCISW
jgi:hypothetical protein